MVGLVLKSGIDTYTVSCVPPPAGVRDLVADLLEVARNSISPSRHAVPVSTEEPITDERTRETNYGRTVPVPMDQRMTDVPDWVKPRPDVRNASDAPIDSQDRSGKHDGDRADIWQPERNANIEHQEPLPDYVPPLPESNSQEPSRA